MSRQRVHAALGSLFGDCGNPMVLCNVWVPEGTRSNGRHVFWVFQTFSCHFFTYMPDIKSHFIHKTSQRFCIYRALYWLGVEFITTQYIKNITIYNSNIFLKSVPVSEFRLVAKSEILFKNISVSEIWYKTNGNWFFVLQTQR